jgi:hypothetical protein
VPATVDLSVSGMSGGNVTQRMLDSTTPVSAGPSLVNIGTGGRVSVSFTGFGAALLEFGGTSGVGTPTGGPRTRLSASLRTH